MAVEKVRFICSICRNKSWFEVNLEAYLVKATDLVCDECIPEDPEVDFHIVSVMEEE